jgi:hypothetical protein
VKGEWVGRTEGLTVGRTDGRADGLNVGGWVGLRVGSSVGAGLLLLLDPPPMADYRNGFFNLEI